MTVDPDFEAWINLARKARLEDECARRQLKLTRGTERTGPCPICRDGKDRFAVNTRKQIWSCRKCGTGGDAIKLVMMIDGCDFAAACETLAGEPPPRGRAMTAEERVALQRRNAELDAKAAQEKADRDAQQDRYKEDERKRLFDNFWKCGGHAQGSVVGNYLAGRGVPMLPPNAALRFAPRAPYYHGMEPNPGKQGRQRPRIIHTGPAMIAAITDAQGIFRGLHFTYLEEIAEHRGHWRKLSPGLDENGEPLPAKKVRGSKKGNRIVLRGPAAPLRLFLGEGIETVLSVWYDYSRTGKILDSDAYWSSVDLGNLSGTSAESVDHPTQRVTDAKGRTKPRKVGAAVPDLGSAAIIIPASVTEVVLLGDGDSDHFITEMALMRAAARIHSLFPQVKAVRIAWADDGRDFNDMVRGAA